MQRYFVKTNQIENKKAHIKGQDAHHIKNVMRAKTNDQLILCDDLGTCYKTSIVSIATDTVVVSLNEQMVNTNRTFKVTIAQALIRRERFEYMLQKSTELGVDYIIPTITKHAIVKLNESKQQNKIERWNMITKEASEQSHRNTTAIVTEVMDLRSINYSEYDLILIAYENENKSSQLVQVLSKPYQNILVLIGPEGGFDPKEIKYLEAQNGISVGLGPRILRSETASSYILSVLSFVYEMRDVQ